MKIYVHAIQSHKGSMHQAQESIVSFEKFGYQTELVYAYVDHEYVDQDLVRGAVVNKLYDENQQLRHEAKRRKLCNTRNQIELWKRVSETGETAVFAEHDALCDGELLEPGNGEIMYYGAQASIPFGKNIMQIPGFNRSEGKYYLRERNYPFVVPHFRHNHRQAKLPNTICYAITPKAAKALLKSVGEHGADQAEFMLNTGVVDIYYIIPAPVNYNENLNLTGGIEPLIT